MRTLYIDTHKTKIFEIGFYDNETLKIDQGIDTSLEMLDKIEHLTKNQFEEIIICTGPGSLTGLRIGSCFAQGMSLAKNIQTKGINIWDLIFKEYENIEVYFHTGTKKWIYKTKTEEKLIEKPCKPNGVWTSNSNNLLTEFDPMTYQDWPHIIELMHKYNQFSSKNIELLYPIDLFKF